MKIYDKLGTLGKKIFWGKMIGFLLSILGVLSIIVLVEGYQAYTKFLYAVLLWYPMLGAMITLSSVMEEYPIFKWKLYLWRGVLIGAVFNFIFALLAYEKIVSLFEAFLNVELSEGVIISVVVLEGVLVGLLIDYVTTKKFGEGRKLREG